MKEYAVLTVMEELKEPIIIILFQYNNKTKFYHELIFKRMDESDKWFKEADNCGWVLTRGQFKKGKYNNYNVNNQDYIFLLVKVIEANFYDYDEFMEKHFEAFL